MLQPLPTQAPEMRVSTPSMDALPMQTPAEGENTLAIPGDDGSPDDGGAGLVQELEAHLDQLPDQDKAFLAEHLTQEFVRAIGLINGPEVAQYLNQFVDPNKILVPVPRQIAEQYLAEQKAQQGGPAPQPQGQPSPQPQAAPMAPPQGQPMPPQGGGMMAPKV